MMIIHLLGALALAAVLFAVLLYVTIPAHQVEERDAVREMERIEREFSGVRNDS